MAAVENKAQAVVDAVYKKFGSDLEHADPVGLNRTAMKSLAEQGFFDIDVLSKGAFNPADIHQIADAITALAYRSPLLSSVYLVSGIFCGLCVSLLGTKEQKSEILGGLTAGNRLLAFAMTEPQAGSDITALESGFTRDGDDIILSGKKQFITGSSVADSILMICREQGDNVEKRALTIVLVPTDVEGLSIEPMPKLSANAQPSCRIEMDNIRLPATQILGGPEATGKAFMPLRIAAGLERLSIAVTATASAQRAYDIAAEFAREREQFGQTIVNYQAIQHRLVDMAMLVRSMKLMADDATASAASGEMSALKICMAKAWCGEKLQDVVLSAMRIFGGRGYFLENEIASLYQGSPIAMFAGGTIELQKNLIARELKLS